MCNVSHCSVFLISIPEDPSQRIYTTGDGYRNCCPRRIPVKEEVILEHKMKRDETRWEYSTNLGEKRRISGSRGYRDMMERGSEKERPDGGQGSDDASDAPHRKPFGGNPKPHPVPLLLPSGMSWHGKNRKRPVKH